MLTTIGAACRAVKAETLERVVDRIVEKLRGSTGRSLLLRLPLLHSNFAKAQVT
jgi:hypothetical protein